jgi:phosphoribosylamine--glycine ligase
VGGVRVLVLGSGGREHALVAALAADPQVTQVVAAPGNPGMAQVATLRPVDVLDPGGVAALATQERVDLVVIGPEAPLAAGVADAVRAAGVACFGPSAEATRLESSKAFAKEVMAAVGAPTAASMVCTTQAEAEVALKTFGPPYVVKNDGLAAGKGVVVTDDYEAALAHAVACGRVVIEEYLDGPEASLFVVTDGETAVPLLPARDYKRLGDGDTGPNTGGMGAYCPLPWAPPDLTETVLSTVVHPVLGEMRRRGTPFAGLLYCGLALTAAGPKVVEFNARFGDPETQVVLPLLESSLATLLYAAATGTLSTVPPLVWRDASAVTVVIASAGYPGRARTGDVITGAEGEGYLHAGTRRLDDGRLVTAGGRVLCCTGVAPTLSEARERAYELVHRVHIDGAQFRTDIAAR